MSRCIQAALVGCGVFGGFHAKALREVQSLRFRAFCDVDDEQARKYCAEYDGDYAADLDRILADDAIEALFICTRHDTHAESALRALRAGKHVFVEKPMAMNMADCEEILRETAASGKKFFMGFRMRYYPLFNQLRDRLPSPLVTAMTMMTRPPPDGHWINDPVHGGGMIIAQACHSCDCLYYAHNSEPVEVFAHGGRLHTGTSIPADNAVATFRFENGSCASLVQGDLGISPLLSKFFLHMFEVGKVGVLHDRFGRLSYEDGETKIEETTDEQTPDGADALLVVEDGDFARCIIDDTEPAITAVDGLRANLMLFKLLDSLKSGRPEKIDLAENLPG